MKSSGENVPTRSRDSTDYSPLSIIVWATHGISSLIAEQIKHSEFSNRSAMVDFRKGQLRVLHQFDEAELNSSFGSRPSEFAASSELEEVSSRRPAWSLY